MAYANHNGKDLDVAVFGASGYTGRLVAEYLGRQDGVAWAMVGRNQSKLEAVRDEINAPSDTQILVADADDLDALKSVCERAKVVLTTVGPYQLYGDKLVQACVETGTDYVDLCGEPNWMHDNIDQYYEAAKSSGARIVFSCGFDSIPFDLGVLTLQNETQKRHNAPATTIRTIVRDMKGTFSGGTAASFKATLASAMKDPTRIQLLQNPFALTPGFNGPEQPAGMTPHHDDGLGIWLAPFIMAAINTKVVHRTNYLKNHAYGKDFIYSEMVATGPGKEGEAAANAVAAHNPLAGDDAPKPGEGPSKEERETGYYDVLFVGETDTGETVHASVKGDKDPGYGSTSKMISEAALCLVHNCDNVGGAVTTPGAALGEALVTRLEAHAGLTFAIES